MALRIVTDSASDLPASLAEQLNVTVVPAYVILDDVSYRDGVDITQDEFFNRLIGAARLPTTSQPTAADFEAVYRELLEQGHQVLSIHVSAKLSGTLNSAIQAKSALGEDQPIEIIDSQLASIPVGLLVMDAAGRADTADSLTELASYAGSRIGRHNGFFALDTLEYLAKGGRIGKAASFLGSILSVKPILSLSEGEVHPLERPRTMARALNRLIELVSQEGQLDRLAVIYSTGEEAAQRLRHTLAGMDLAEEVILARFGPALGAHVGPNAVGVAFSSSAGDGG